MARAREQASAEPPGDPAKVLADAESRMEKTRDVLRRELVTIRTGRAHPALVEHVRVDYYGQPTPLAQLATITVPEARMIVIQPWDRSSLAAIERAIQRSDLGVNPTNDGTTIRIVLPPLSEQRRQELVRQVRRMVEEAKVALRNIRRDAAEELRDLERNKAISEDEHRRWADRLQRLLDQFTHDLDQIGKEKETEIMTV